MSFEKSRQALTATGTQSMVVLVASMNDATTGRVTFSTYCSMRSSSVAFGSLIPVRFPIRFAGKFGRRVVTLLGTPPRVVLIRPGRLVRLVGRLVRLVGTWERVRGLKAWALPTRRVRRRRENGRALDCLSVAMVCPRSSLDEANHLEKNNASFFRRAGLRRCCQKLVVRAGPGNRKQNDGASNTRVATNGLSSSKLTHQPRKI
jgi:hypothetical protein